MRERMVTRTITSTEVNTMVFVKSTKQNTEKVFTLSGVFTEENAEKYLRKHCETADEKIVCVLSVETKEQIYGMSETDFIKNAHVMKDYFNKA